MAQKLSAKQPTEIVGPVLSEEDALDLTTRIDALTGAMDTAYETRCELLLQAKEGCAWLALDVSSWQSYVKEREGMSRANSYRMLAVGRVNRQENGQQQTGVSRGETVSRDEPKPKRSGVTTRHAAAVERRKPLSPVDVESKTKPIETKPEQMRLWPDDPQKAMFASFDVVLDQLGPEKTGKLLGTMQKRVESATPPKPTLVDATSQTSCSHPKNREDKKPYGVWCGECRKKIR